MKRQLEKENKPDRSVLARQLLQNLHEDVGKDKVLDGQTDEVAEVQEECWRKNPRLRPGTNLVALRKTGLITTQSGK